MLVLRPMAALAALFSLPVLADPVVLDPVQVTAGRVAESNFEVPQPVTVLTAEDIARKTPQVMAELLRGEAGVFFQQTGPGQGMAIVRRSGGGVALPCGGVAELPESRGHCERRQCGAGDAGRGAHRELRFA